MAYTTVDDAGLFFNTKLYTGDGSTQSITGVGFQPDLIWGKQRTDSGANWFMFDAARGTANLLESDTAAVPDTDATSLTAFDSDGFTLGAYAQSNENTKTMVSYNWKGGTTTGIDTTGSTITPSAYSFNQTSRFSVIGYTGNATSGAKLPHGLGVTPTMAIFKNLQTTESWMVYQKYLHATPEDYAMQLNTQGAAADNVGNFNDTVPDSVNMTLGDGAGTNSANTFIAYFFADVQGYSKFSSYTANSNADGIFVYTGFKPAFVLIKATLGSINWNIFDTKRTPYNPEDPLWANTTGSESSIGSYNVDLVSNGFKIKTVSSQVNATSVDPYIYAAFAESPLVNSEGVPTNAR